jgi:hypothetical protein
MLAKPMATDLGVSTPLAFAAFSAPMGAGALWLSGGLGAVAFTAPRFLPKQASATSSELQPTGHLPT